MVELSFACPVCGEVATRDVSYGVSRIGPLLCNGNVKQAVRGGLVCSAWFIARVKWPDPKIEITELREVKDDSEA